METIGIILAGGSGHRIGGNIPKQFLPLAGKTILEHTVSIFNSHPEITQIFIVTHAQYQEETKRLLQGNDFSKVTQILTGGKERYHSTLSALRACPANECNLIIHDAVRPLVSPQMISACIRALEETEACSTAIPATDTIFVSDQSGKYVSEIPDRNFLFNVQTPQAFRKSILTEAFRRVINI